MLASIRLGPCPVGGLSDLPCVPVQGLSSPCDAITCHPCSSWRDLTLFFYVYSMGINWIIDCIFHAPVQSVMMFIKPSVFSPYNYHGQLSGFSVPTQVQKMPFCCQGLKFQPASGGEKLLTI